MNKRVFLLSGVLIAVSIAVCLATWLAVPSKDAPPTKDWPQWRYDAGRSAATPHALPGNLQLQWQRQLPQPRPAWPASQPSLRFDLSYSPVAAGGRLLVPSMVTDSVTAYDTAGGVEKWRFYTDGPVRLAPVAHGGKVYFGSDDGYLYCVDAADGGLLWRFRGGPSDRRVLGNGRLISTWPVRGGPVLFEGNVYFTAGIWPFMGIFIHAVDAQTGKAVWTNSSQGAKYQTHPHNSPAFGGLVPRGHLAVTRHGLIAPGGRTSPGCFDLETGELLSFQFAKRAFHSPQVSARRQWYFFAGLAAGIADGQPVAVYPGTVHDDEALYGMKDGEIRAHSFQIEKTADKKKDSDRTPNLKSLWSANVADAPGRLFLKAGRKFVAGGDGEVAVIDANSASPTGEVVWRSRIEGSPWTMLAADDRLFVVTVEGRIYCFGGQQGSPKRYELPTAAEAAAQTDRWPRTAEAVLKATGAAEGHCVVLGLGSGGLAESLARQSKLHVIVIEADAQKIDAFRRRMQQAGLYGTRVAAVSGDPLKFPLPPYLATLIVSEDAALARSARGEQFAAAVFHRLRPYGGVACLPVDLKTIRGLWGTARPADARLKAAGKDWSLVTRPGALPGAGDWTHQYADAGNTSVSQDELAKAPLGLLWFGGPPNDEVLPRHGHGPAPQAAAGRLLIEGPDMLRALDAYTGRLLWQKDLPGLGGFYNVTAHQPGAGEIGSNYVTLADAVYVVYGPKILELDPATGEQTGQFELQPGPGDSQPNWGFMAAWEDLLVATSTPVAVAAAKTAAGSDGGKSAELAKYQPIVPRGASWQYLAGTDPKGDWTVVDYDAQARPWKTGPAGFGYGDDDDRTVLSDMEDRYGRVYVRSEFQGRPAVDASELALVISYDDAFIAYLNGKEVVRTGIKRGNGEKASTIKSHEAKGYEVFPIDDFRKLLLPGRNVLAIEGHNSGLGSSDFSLDPYLAIKNGKPPGAVQQKPKPKPKPGPTAGMFAATQYSSASRRLVVYNRRSGKQLWDRPAEYGWRHNNIAIGAGRLFCIDGLSKAKLQTLRRRGRLVDDYRPRLLALDARTGREVWSTDRDVFGTFLGYSAQHDVLLQSGSSHRDRAKDESSEGMVAYRGRSGKVLWKDLDREFSGPCLLHGDTIIAQGPAYSLLTGKRKTRPHPLSGQPVEWEYRRNYGCNTAIGSRHLLTFRSAAAGYYDLARDGGTGNLGGFKSGCTSNLIVAGGLLCAPEYTRTCTCNYQNQTSLAMLHDPDVETWTFNALTWDKRPVRRVGINLGAPGDRMADDGTLWLDWPSRGGPSPNLPVEIRALEIGAGRVEYFRRHSSLARADPGRGQLAWVAASGARGLGDLTLALAEAGSPPRNYTVRLHFAEPDQVELGQRVFHVKLQGKTLLEDVDLVEEAGGTNRAVVWEFRGVEVTEKLRLALVPSGRGQLPPLLCGVQVAADGW